ncbi:adenosylcobalamin-dependent ribonucleoside-diphosphate reductase [Acidihalobacter prosperus]
MDVARLIWETKYRWSDADGRAEASLDETLMRVASALAAAETQAVREVWRERYFALLQSGCFLPGGRILAGAGTGRRVTLFNCFVMGEIEDSLDGIFEALKEGAQTLQQGGGVGYDFSTLRPAGTPARSSGMTASGPVSFMRLWDTMSATLLSTGTRRGAMMATLRCDHPDIERFVEAKRQPGALSHFNLSVLVSDAFMRAVEQGEDWPLVFPAASLSDTPGDRVMRTWSAARGEEACVVLRRVPARELWERIMRGAYERAEPGVLFIDRINRDNNLGWRERISATNPCGEIPLPPYGACDLGSLNLVRYVRRPYTPEAYVDLGALEADASVAVRMLDAVIDVSGFPLPAQEREARANRRIGLGLTGLADALLLVGLDYGSRAAREQAAAIMRAVGHAAYRASAALAREKGAFPNFSAQDYLSAPFVARLPQDIREQIAAHGIRNSHCLAIAPAGSISLLAGNVSSGIEPVYSVDQRRRLIDGEGRERELLLVDWACELWRNTYPGEPFPESLTTAAELSPEAHLEMQAVLQPHVDNAISKTVNVPPEIPFGDFRALYERAYALGLKGCTAFRPNEALSGVLAAVEPEAHCCSALREGD